MTKLNIANCVRSFLFEDCTLVETGKNVYLAIETQDSKDDPMTDETYLVYELDPNDLVGVIRYVQNEFAKDGATTGSRIRPVMTGVTKVAAGDELIRGLKPSFLLECGA